MHPTWGTLYVQPVEERWAAMIVTDGVDSPNPGELKGRGFFGDTPADAKELALRYLGGCVEQN